MQQDTKENLANRNIWARGLYMLFYGLAYAVAEAVATLVVVFQFIHTLFTGKVNEPLQIFGARLSMYVYQILQYVTFNSEFQPFPFSDWPDTEAGDTPWSGAQSIADRRDIDSQEEPPTSQEAATTTDEPRRETDA